MYEFSTVSTFPILFEAGGLFFLIHFGVGLLLKPYSDIFLKRDLLNASFRMDAREKDKLVSKSPLVGRQPTSAMAHIKDSSLYKFGKTNASKPSRVSPSETIGVGPGENLTARGTIIRNLQTLKTAMDVRTFLWYLVEKVQSADTSKIGLLQLLACKFCRRNWDRSGRVLRLVGKGKKRLQNWSEITTLMKAKINSDLLAQRLLNSE